MRTRIDGREVVCLKATRLGKDYINHYVIPLDPVSEGDLTMLYVDYEVVVIDCHGKFVLALEPVEVDEAPEIGHVLVNDKGSFIKVRESYKGSWALGYVELESGEVRRRQERGVTGVFRWRLMPNPHAGVMGTLRSMFRL